MSLLTIIAIIIIATIIIFCFIRFGILPVLEFIVNVLGNFVIALLSSSGSGNSGKSKGFGGGSSGGGGASSDY